MATTASPARPSSTTVGVRSLAYLGLEVTDVAAWRTYAELLGTMVVDGPDGGVSIRTDERAARILVDPGDDRLGFVGWEVGGPVELDRAAGLLAAAGHEVAELDADACEHRRVKRALVTTDPGGFRTELCCGPLAARAGFVSSSGGSGFVTGELGFGHLVLATPELDATVAFYTDVLGFRISDTMPAGDDDVWFLRCNPRHHSVAMFAADEPALHHFMLEAASLDDVGFALERHLDTGTPYAQGLGRHMGDEMLSFYSRSPSGFQVEFGHGGVHVDEATWVTGQMAAPSHWGHHPPST